MNKKINLQESIDWVIEHVWEQEYLYQYFLKSIPKSDEILEYHQPVSFELRKNENDHEYDNPDCIGYIGTEGKTFK